MATHTDVPAVNIFYPPPRIVIIDCIGDVHVRDLQKLGDFCKFCCGSGRCIKCHFCVEGIDSIPKHPKREKVTLDLQPTR